MSTGFELPGEDHTEEARPEEARPKEARPKEARPTEVRPTFGSVRRGYDPNEVDAFLAHVTSSIHILEARLRKAAQETPHDVPDRLEQRFAKMLAVQEREAETLLTEAHVEAVAIVAEAKEEADRIRGEGRGDAEGTIEEADALRQRATEEADHVRTELAEQRRELSQRFPAIRQRLLAFLRDVDAALSSLEGSSAAERPTDATGIGEDQSAT